MAPDSAIHTAGSIAALVTGEVRPSEATEVAIAGVESLDGASPEHITFITSASHARNWAASRAGAALIAQGALDAAQIDHRPLIIVPDAELALIKVLELFQPPPPLPDQGVHPTAFVHPSAKMHHTARLGPHASIDRGAVIGTNVVLHAGVRIYPEVTIGDDSIIHANTVIRELCIIGRRVIVHQNASIGADGFGYRPGPLQPPDAGSDERLPGGEEDPDRGARTPALLKMPHLGNVILEDDVEIGAGVCIDRGKFPSTTTMIGAGTKIDNLVQIAHNCRIGRNCVIAGMAGLAGSVTVGDWVQIGAQVGVMEGLNIGSGAKIGGKAGVMNDVPPGEIVYGIPATPRREALRLASALRKLPEALDRLKQFER